ncbi:hypothetical protein P3X46_028887 [Hevea brasiliensis]|uniref:RING-type domain-containing protein n=1 Tax=Hevea brasiliensis TaxID=3981 RepID=A0ABQ9KQJ5_HEVBR|nr:hypothetical protein P3X46_028887 [Hevea brasiliensis]
MDPLLIVLPSVITFFFFMTCCRPPQILITENSGHNNQGGGRTTTRPRQRGQEQHEREVLGEPPGQFVMFKSNIMNCSECAICLEEFEDGEPCWVLTKCKHVYHAFCINQWLAKDRHCPLCRGSVRNIPVNDNLNQVSA